MNILFLTHWYPSLSSPISGVFIREHAVAVSSLHRVTVLHIAGIEPGLSSLYRINNTQWGPINEVHLVYKKSAIPKTSLINRLAASLMATAKLQRSGDQIDIIHANIFSTADLAFFLGKRFQVPTVLSEHASAYSRNLLTRPQAVKARLFMNRLDRILPVCRTVAEAMKHFGIHARFEIIPNTIDTNLFKPRLTKSENRNGIYKLITISSLTANKSVSDIITAVHLLESSPDHYELTIIGDGPERSRLEQYAQKIIKKSKVRFLGWKSKLEIAQYLSQADIFILASKWENQPVALLEAISTGLPVVASNVGGIPEIMLPEHGLLFTHGAPLELAEKIRQILDSIAHYSPDAAHAYIQQNYSYPVIAQKFDDVYHAVLK